MKVRYVFNIKVFLMSVLNGSRIHSFGIEGCFLRPTLVSLKLKAERALLIVTERERKFRRTERTNLISAKDSYFPISGNPIC